jgi:methionyl-tRNA formyltransferase
MIEERTYVVAGSKEWNRHDFTEVAKKCPGRWLYISNEDELCLTVGRESPRYIFFLHWNWRVPAEIFSRFECVCFHMTDVPYGRGGSPLQNLIVAGHEQTVVSALQMVEEMDAGPVYVKRPMSLAGRAEDIYVRAGAICIDIIQWMIKAEPAPVPQAGTPVLFKRRKPAQSELPAVGDVGAIYNHIRMLDAPSYPLAFVEHGCFRLEFLNAQLVGDEIVARVVIKTRPEKD